MLLLSATVEHIKPISDDFAGPVHHFNVYFLCHSSKTSIKRIYYVRTKNNQVPTSEKN